MYNFDPLWKAIEWLFYAFIVVSIAAVGMAGWLAYIYLF